MTFYQMQCGLAFAFPPVGGRPFSLHPELCHRQIVGSFAAFHCNDTRTHHQTHSQSHLARHQPHQRLSLTSHARRLQVVAFVKGTRTQPQCGFSYKVLSTLNELGADYEVLNVLDEVHNPGLREAIKEYSQWPTIPQVPLFI